MVLLARRGAAALLAPLISSLMTPMHPLHADTVVPTAKPVVTNRCRLSINIGNGEQRELILALFGEEAPASVALFKQLCDGSLGFGSYRGSIATRVEPNKQIVLGRLSAGSSQFIDKEIDNTGYVRSTLVNRAESFTNTDKNSLSHDGPGVLSMRRGGGAFEFSLTSRAAPALDSSWIVIGQVEQGLDLIADLNQVPVRKPSANDAAYSAVARAAKDPRARVEQPFRPLLKIQIAGAEVLPQVDR